MKPILSVNHLVQKRGRKTLLKDISFDVLPGERFGVFGTRGTGKTALLHILAGVDRFTSGQVEILNFNVQATEKYKRDIGLVTQERSLFSDMSVGENLDFIAVLKKAAHQDIQEMITRFELADYLSTPVADLDSVGVFQRLSLACAMLNHPRVLIADDVIKDIDLNSRHLILRELDRFQSEGGTCVWAFSDIRDWGLMSKVGCLAEGEMTLHTPEADQEEWNWTKAAYAVPYGARA
ncbi:ATP-binding cassette domain-containing protein [Desulfitobacterium sp. Sab5]|uniref:ATP-binding cassette domain-containing protein n=1 Tax=Desulfitobacterium nosdiversum TaxID=3375356 RepID=UPI003CF0500C